MCLMRSLRNRVMRSYTSLPASSMTASTSPMRQSGTFARHFQSTARAFQHCVVLQPSVQPSHSSCCKLRARRPECLSNPLTAAERPGAEFSRRRDVTSARILVQKAIETDPSDIDVIMCDALVRHYAPHPDRDVELAERRYRSTRQPDCSTMPRRLR